jgi:hypothetical protein
MSLQQALTVLLAVPIIALFLAWAGAEQSLIGGIEGGGAFK